MKLNNLIQFTVCHCDKITRTNTRATIYVIRISERVCGRSSTADCSLNHSVNLHHDQRRPRLRRLCVGMIPFSLIFFISHIYSFLKCLVMHSLIFRYSYSTISSISSIILNKRQIAQLTHSLCFRMDLDIAISTTPL